MIESNNCVSPAMLYCKQPLTFPSQQYCENTKRREAGKLSKNTKLKVVNATMIPMLMCGCEAWSLSKNLQSRVQVAHMRVLRRIEGVNKIHRVRNEVIRESLG